MRCETGGAARNFGGAVVGRVSTTDIHTRLSEINMNKADFATLKAVLAAKGTASILGQTIKKIASGDGEAYFKGTPYANGEKLDEAIAMFERLESMSESEHGMSLEKWKKTWPASCKGTGTGGGKNAAVVDVDALIDDLKKVKIALKAAVKAADKPKAAKPRAAKPRAAKA